MQKFIEYLSSLAPEGETPLIVRQTIPLVSGVPLYYGDGKVKSKWTAYYPYKGTFKPTWAVYGNTGSFMLDRLDESRPSASSANCEYVLCMILDDVGDPEKAPKISPLPPTWIMETSEGCYQWGYAFSEQPHKGEFTAAIKAITAAGYSDPYSINPVRNFRIPGSVNLKPGKKGFKARLVEFHPDKEYTLQEICAALDVAPAEADTYSIPTVKLDGAADDPVLHWLNDNKLLLSPVNREGWCAVVCPNHDSHSTPEDIAARYHPVDRAFLCYHSHCQEWTSQKFLDWVAEQGGPSVTHGIRSELISDTLQIALQNIQPSDLFEQDAESVMQDVMDRELGRVTKQHWFTRFAYIQNEDSYFDLQERREVTRSTFNALYRHVECKSIHGKNRVEASVCYDQNREKHGAKALVGLTYAPGETTVVAKDGELHANRWRDARPEVDKTMKADISLWLEHGRHIIPNEDELNHVLNVMAYKVQHPERKINHAVLHAGYEGNGKDTLWGPFIWAVCGPNLRNRGYLNNDTLNAQWGYHLESEVLLINELKEPDAKERRLLANKLKEVIAAPPEYLSINRKGLSPYLAVNRLFVLAFSNNRVPISIASQDRRWFAVWSSADKMDPDKAKRMWDWYNNGGFEQIAAWLYQRDVSMFNPAAPPMETEYKQSLVENGRSAAEAYLVDMIQCKTGEFSKGVVGSPFMALADRLSGTAPQGVKITQHTVLHALEEAKWVDIGRIKSARYGTKKQAYCSPDMANYSKSDLRDMLESYPEPVNLRMVK